MILNFIKGEVIVYVISVFIGEKFNVFEYNV